MTTPRYNDAGPWSVEGDTADVLWRRGAPSNVMAVWRRALPPGVASWIDHRPPEQLPHIRRPITAAHAATVLETCFDAAGSPAAEQRGQLIRHLAGLIACYGVLAELTEVDMRLERIDGPGCWRFHQDHVDRRLLTVLRGAGTQWVGPASAPAALGDQQAYRGPVHQFRRGDVSLFRGTRSAGSAALVHRAPPHRSGAGCRWLFCLNAPLPS